MRLSKFRGGPAVTFFLLAALGGCSGSGAAVGTPDVGALTDLGDDLGTDAGPADSASTEASVTDSEALDLGAVDIGVMGDQPVVPDDAPAPVDAPSRCVTNADCVGNPAGSVCEVASGRCVQCLVANDTCPASQHCDAMNNTCVPGCRSDEGCVSMEGTDDAGTATRRGRCDVRSRACVECVADDHCPPGSLCVGSVCVIGCNATRPCPTGQSCCSDSCVDTAANLAHCGACGSRCSVPNATPSCANGRCGVATCNAPFGDCDSNGANGCEANTRTDTQHCGACGTVCPARANATATCSDGRCGIQCAEGFADCDMNPANGCEANLRTDVGRCGQCANACNPPNATAVCTDGRCAIGQCTAGFGDCDGNPTNGCETNLRTSTTHCGTCSNECSARANSFPGCVLGQCVISCVAGFSDCDASAMNGCETDTRGDVRNCGICGRQCSAPGGMARCALSVCQVAGCDPGLADCDMMSATGCETDVRSSVAHCGGCGMACPARTNATPSCAAGRCGIVCGQGFGDCDQMAVTGCEVNTTNTVAHCGACGRACSLSGAVPSCVGGTCRVATCSTGLGDCDANPANGCEVDVRSSVAHCGGCGRACAFANAAAACNNGACSMGACSAGFSDCDRNPANGCETRGTCQYTTCRAVPAGSPSGTYTLTVGGAPWESYCELGADGGGWALALKADGNRTTFLYSSALWTDTNLLNVASANMSLNEAKLRGFIAMPFTEMRLCMLDGSLRCIVVPFTGTSLRDVFASGRRPTNVGRNAWRSLVASPSLQPFCNAEGFNVDGSPYGRVRLGILTNQENDCATVDSRLGFGGQYNMCGPGDANSVGNVASCGPDNGDRDARFFGFIFVR